MGGGGSSSGLSANQRMLKLAYDKISKTSDAIRGNGYETALFFDQYTGEEVYERVTQYEPHSVYIPNNSRTYGKTVVHNHPSGSCFSGEDLYMAKVLACEVWAVTTEHNFLFKWNNPQAAPSDFKDKVNAMHAKMRAKAREDWEKKHGTVDEIIKRHYEKHEITVREMNQLLEERKPGIEKLYRKKTIDWFKNNSKKYGYKFSARRI